MFLKELTKNRLLTITHYQNESLQICKGHIFNLDLNKQALILKDIHEKVNSIRISGLRKLLQHESWIMYY
ncbi:hypothetical protein [Metabacillus niabensis]|uniref:hypothetical protein n=1 Tax=Metabacillus niabensis TaxID=324854 RepID=UPI001CFB0BB2|nr:hypothetical protein [Metabacillus niabensis]